LFLPCSTDAGAWLVARDDGEQCRHLKAAVSTEPQTFEDGRSRHTKAEQGGTSIKTDADDGRVLDGFFLVNSDCSSSSQHKS